MATKSTTPATTPSGADPFAGAPGDTSPAPTGSTPAAAATPGLGMPTYTGDSGTGKTKTFGGIPLNQFAPDITVPGYHPPGAANYVGDQTGTSTQPLYQDGDQWAPASYSDPDRIRDLQTQLVESGLLKTSQVHFGIWDQNSAAAYAKVLAQANLQGAPAGTVMDQYVSSALPAASVNPSDFKAMANQAGQQFLGRDLTADELTRFEGAFMSAVAVEGAPTSDPGKAQLAGDILTKQEPKAVQANSLHQVSQKALQILSSPSVSLPSPQ